MLKCSKLFQNAETPLVVLGLPRIVAASVVNVVISLLIFHSTEIILTLQTWFT